MSTITTEAGLQMSSVAVPERVLNKKKGLSQNALLFWVGFSLLLLPGLINAYLLMPFPGSQNIEAITFCYYLEKIITPLRLAGALVLAIYLFRYFPALSRKRQLLQGGLILAALISFYFTDFEYKAERMFEEPKDVNFATAWHNKVPLANLVIGVVHNGVAKAYPVIYLGYHHKVQDNVNGLPVVVTYCTMCRTGMVFNPVINGKRENFRLVGARHYNAILEDASTKTWWYQATGIAAVGPEKGRQLQELPYEQSTLSNWLKRYPSSLILQPDANYEAGYRELKNYDRVQAVDRDSTLTDKDALVRKSWVLGVKINGKAKAYNWRNLVSVHVINDSFAGTNLLVGVESDSLSYHVWQNSVDGKALHFKTYGNNQLTDAETSSVWNWEGTCLSGVNKGKQLTTVKAYQEYWHSWKHFNPATLYSAE